MILPVHYRYSSLTFIPNLTLCLFFLHLFSICCNPTIERAKNAAERFGIPEYCADAEDVITHPDIEAVWICSPSQYHADQIILCAKHGKHVFCEKPIATDLQETILAIDACRAAGVKLMIGLQRRFDKNFARVKQSMEQKEVGEPFLVRWVKKFAPAKESMLF